MEPYNIIHWLTVLIILVGLLFIVLKKPVISSDNSNLRSLGMSLTISKWLLFLVVQCVLLFVLREYIIPGKYIDPALLLIDIVYVLSIFKRYVGFCSIDRKQKDSVNHLYQSTVLVCIFILLVYFLIHFDISKETFLPFSLCAGILGLLFNDSIKGMVAFFHLHSNNLLHIGDWIVIPNQNIDGIVTDISLVTVSVRNWDSTVSNISITSLQNGTFRNCQNILEGKTNGRKMDRSFIIDSHSIKQLSQDELKLLQERLIDNGQDTIELSEYKEGSHTALNIYLFRKYLIHWLMNHPEVTRYPQLLVCFKEATPEGIPLHISIFITKIKKLQFEEVQSSIIEHLYLSMGWFGLDIYQRR